MNDPLWKEVHYWEYKKKYGPVYRIVKDENGKWILLEGKKISGTKPKMTWVTVMKNLRTRAEAKIEAEKR
jgi:hypothetical protein